MQTRERAQCAHLCYHLLNFFFSLSVAATRIIDFKEPFEGVIVDFENHVRFCRNGGDEG